MDSSLDLRYERLLGEGSYGKVFLVKQQDGQQVTKLKTDTFLFLWHMLLLFVHFINLM